MVEKSPLSIAIRWAYHRRDDTETRVTYGRRAGDGGRNLLISDEE